MLQALGWTVLSVPFYEYFGQRSSEQKVRQSFCQDPASAIHHGRVTQLFAQELAVI